ncbi:transposase [Streptomyces sp. NPDC057910]|uniref:transposase n=1 Tax=Streptomyces sp. NPDC057910 TaxID=3346278 RepID=UPI0036EDA151
MSCCGRSSSSTWRRPRSTQCCWTAGSTCARSRRCTGSCAGTARSASGAGRPPTPPRKKPELTAQSPNRVWSRDITKLKGPVKGSYNCLYTIIDIYSRYTTGWMIATAENKELAEQFLSSTILKYEVERGRLTVHSDRGSPMVAENVAQMMSNLGVTKSHSRPKTSNDNPYSESQYKTLKHRHDFPDRFGCIKNARAWCEDFFDWY